MATYSFLYVDLFIWNYDEHFGGFWIEPKKGSLMTWIDFTLGATIMGGLLLLELNKQKISPLIKKHNLQRYSSFALVALLGVQLYILSNSGIMLASLEKMDQAPPRGWDAHVFEVIDYLKSAENGNVLALRVPAVPFFTNRTNFDLFNYYSISPSLLTENSSLLKQEISDMGVRYIVIPNEENPLYYLVQNLMKQSKLVQIINTDDEFDRIVLEHFNIYKYNPESQRINLLDDAHKWKARKNVALSQFDGNLNISVISNHTDKKKNIALLKTRLNLTDSPLLMSLSYASNSSLGTATFKLGIGDRNEDKLLFSSILNNTSGILTNQTFILHENIDGGRPLEFTLYIITDGPGQHALNLKRFHIAYS